VSATPPAYVRANDVAPAPRRPLYRRGWFWAAIGAAALTAVVTVVLASSTSPATRCAPSDCNLGMVLVP
jgi:hypothetical protein